MALHHKHAPICPISRALCRLMDIFAEGLFLDEADAHLKVSQLFERLNCYSVEAKKRYNLDSEERQKNLLADHGIVSYTAPTDLEEVLMKRLKMIEKKDAMKKKRNEGENKRKFDDTGFEGNAKKQRFMDGSGNSMGVNMDKRRDEMEKVDGHDNGKQHVNGEMENEAKNGENNEERIKESDLGSNDANTDDEAISMQEFEKQMASINAPYGTEAEWNMRKKEWQDMLLSSYGFLSNNTDKREGNGKEDHYIVID